MDAKRFFDVAVPQLAAEHAGLFAALHGRIAFVIQGVGEWTVQLGSDHAPVLPGAARDADLVLSFHRGAFADFIAGTLDLNSAVARGEIAYDGDLSAVTRFGRLLQQAQRS